ncbi:LysR substrate-binding domain-containing protein [Inquilinus sp. CAU 1745]|uniref:LysR substrate-binding domain-containing protein n=1 Tax=Inquilinus sp. CAU 1745 TaxID=3140369 RepID=UPI00325B05F8
MGPVLPLLGLRTLTEVGRRGSVRAGAEAMGVTPGAVSQQIRLLEDRLGLTLFERAHGGIFLSEAGARVHPALVRAFDQIEQALATLEAMKGGEKLTVSASPAFASWLVPRLGGFTKRHPEIEVRIEATTALADLKRDRVDVALRHGLGDYPGLRADRFMVSVLVPVASPALLAEGPPIASPADCLDYPLLHDSDRADWPIWLRAHGIEDDRRAGKGPSLGDDFLLIRAAEAGQGIALIRDLYAREEVAAGRLRIVLDCPWPTRFAYYVVTRPEARQRPAVAAFVDWLTAEATASETARESPAAEA